MKTIIFFCVLLIGATIVSSQTAAQFCTDYAASATCSSFFVHDFGASGEARCQEYFGDLPAVAGHDLACHATALGAGNCAAASVLSDGTCGTPCGIYCADFDKVCGGESVPQYPDIATCMAACEAWDLGAELSTGGDNLRCREYHARVFQRTPDPVHCAHGSFSGGGVCGAIEDKYCELMSSTCPGDYYSAAYCNKVITESTINSGSADATSGHTHFCRLYHVSVANLTGNTAVHCPHASPTGAGVCGEHCEVYCDLIGRDCVAQNIYDSPAQCMERCASIPVAPEATATGGNSIQCRLYHVGVAARESGFEDPHCYHAGFRGDGVCGSFCENYCDTVSNCSVTDFGTPFNRQACERVCDTWSDGQRAAISGNSKQCRLYHLEVANFVATTPAQKDEHCSHAGISGNTACGSPCENYCHLEFQACNNSLGYANMAQCLSACSKLPANAQDRATSGNSLQCRIYHAGVELQTGPSATAHCEHSSFSGGNVCGTNCENYCDLIFDPVNGCVGLYASKAECLAQCPAFDDSAAVGITGGPSVQCRLYHLGVHFNTDPSGTHCPHAGYSGDGVCGSVCENYCHAHMRSCTGVYSGWDNYENCVSVCNVLPLGTSTDTQGNTANCRAYHTRVAIGAPDAHCNHGAVGKDSEGLCGSDCAVYCALHVATCTGTDGYANEAACLTACTDDSMIPKTGSFGDVDL